MARAAAVPETPATPAPPATASGEANRAARWRPSPAGWGARIAVSAALVAAVALFPLTLEGFRANQIQIAVIYAIIGLSINVLMGHAGQIPLGHQAFVGVGAFASAYVVTVQGQSFFLGVLTAGLTGAVSAFVLGLVALRLRGLYLALLTLAYGAVAQQVLFGIRGLTGGGAGQSAPRPAGFVTDVPFLYLCMGFLAVFLFVDWRLMRSKAGRAIVAVRTDERVAASLGINVTRTKLFAFVLSGIMAGVAGSLLAHQTTFVSQASFTFEIALTWVLMTVVGGLESRAGVVIGSMFFALFPLITRELFPDSRIPDYTPLIGAGLLIVTLIQFPGGIGQQLLPIRRWLAGGRFRHGHGRVGAEAVSGPLASDERVEPPSPGAIAELETAAADAPVSVTETEAEPEPGAVTSERKETP